MRLSLRPVVYALCLLPASCGPETGPSPAAEPRSGEDGILRAGFVTRAGVYNSELMAPYDVFHHTIFRDSARYIEPFIVTSDGMPFETFEGITVTPHYDFETAPPIDILVLPSTVGSMTDDLRDTAFMTFVKEAVDRAQFVVTVCDGAFPLAATGALDGRTATTFPADRDALARRYPEVNVLYDARLAVDGKYVTSVGGAMSYEPALYLVERLYGPESARRTAEGLVWPWNLAQVPHRIVEEPARPAE